MIRATHALRTRHVQLRSPRGALAGPGRLTLPWKNTEEESVLQSSAQEPRRMNRPRVDHFPSGVWSNFRAARPERNVEQQYSLRAGGATFVGRVAMMRSMIYSRPTGCPQRRLPCRSHRLENLHVSQCTTHLNAMVDGSRSHLPIVC